MKSKLIIIGIVIICIGIILFQYRRINFYKNDLNQLFGKDKYVVETIDKQHIIFYAINDNNQGFNILLDYMNDLNYKHDIDSQLGALHFFQNSNGEKVACDVTNCRTFIICEIEFKGKHGT